MPELPEVEAAKRLLERGCVGKRIEKAAVANDDKVFDGASPDDVRRVLEGRRVIAVHRKGKYLWLQLDNAEGPWPLLHFGMTGGIVVQKMGATKYKRIHLESDPDEWPPRFTKLELDLEDGAKLAFVDARRFARVKLLVNPPAQEPLSKLGFDVMDELPPLEQFAAAIQKRVARAQGLKIKALLLDQEFCSGIGNWVGDEVLYHARIHPEQSAASLDDAALAALHGAIRSVVTQAVEAEADADRFPRDWLFHYRWTNKKPSFINGQKIEFVTVGSRTSAFVPALQKLAGNGNGNGGGNGGSSGGTRAKGTAAKGKPKGGGARTKRMRGSIKKVASSESEEEEEEAEEDNDEEEEEDSEDDAKATDAKRLARGPAAKASAPAKGGGRGQNKKAAAAARGSSSRKKRVRQQERDGFDSEEAEEGKGASSEGADEGEEVDADSSDEEAARPKKKRERVGKAAAAPAAKKKKGSGQAAAAAADATTKRPAAPRARKKGA